MKAAIRRWPQIGFRVTEFGTKNEELHNRQANQKILFEYPKGGRDVHEKIVTMDFSFL